MNILYIASIFPSPKEGSNLYTDLAEELKEKDNNVTVVVSEEKKKIKKTMINIERNIKVIRVKTGNMYNVGRVEKSISFIELQGKLIRAINKYLSDQKFDMILFMAPPVTLNKVVKFAMKKYNCISYLMQKDIFPQNAIDISILTKYNPAYWYFKKEEKKLYQTATIIGCMSLKNKKYIETHNQYLKKEKIQIFPNTLKIKNKKTTEQELEKTRKKYKIPEEKVIAIFGGNFGEAQGIEFLIKVLNEYKHNNKVEFILCGKGTKKNKMQKEILQNNIRNVIIIDFINNEEYFKLLKISDIGLVFLDNRFTVPNIPSKTLSYFEAELPIMAATDRNTDYKQLIEDDSKAGLWCESKDLEEFKKKFNFLLKNKKIRKEMGKRGRWYLEKYLTTEVSVKILETTLKKIKEEKDV